jgi:signal transduction histidine kinase
MARDAGLVLLFVVPSVLLGANPLMPRAIDQKMIVMLGSPEAWRLHLLWWWTAALPAVVAVLLRRRWPLLAFALAAASGLAHLLDPILPLLPIDLAAAVTLYTLASVARSRRAGAVALAVAVVVLYPVCVLTGAGRPGWSLSTRLTVATAHLSGDILVTALSAAAIPTLLLGIAWVAGDNMRTRRRYLAVLEQRAGDLRRERDQRAVLAAAAERARLTRELHDVIAHGMSVIVVQAQAAAAALPLGSAESAQALTHIVDTGRASLAEMRQVVGARHERTGRDPDLAPQPGLGAIPALIDQVRDAGTPVALHVEGEPVPLPAGADLSAYRVVQEALTNVRKHAGPLAHATVRLMFRPSQFEIDVTDDGTGAAAAATRGVGNGLRGIAERVTALGGTAEAGPRASGGFGVRASLPTRVPR